MELALDPLEATAQVVVVFLETFDVFLEPFVFRAQFFDQSGLAHDHVDQRVGIFAQARKEFFGSRLVHHRQG